MKKFVLFIFSLVIGLLVFCGLSVKADAITITLVDAAQVRTSGDYQGLRFQASVNTLEGTNEHGFFLALGTHSLSEMTTAINGGSATVGANKLLKKETTGEDLTFAVTIFDIPEAYYTTGITAVAYTYDDTSYTLSGIKVTRNIAEVAMNALNEGTTGAILTSVATYLSEHYMVKASGLNIFGEYTITPLATVKYGFSNLSALYAEFIADYNAATGASLTTSSTATEFFNSLKTGVASEDREVNPNANMAKMFSGYRLVKWQWLLNYFKNNYSDHIPNQATALTTANRTAPTYTLHSFDHLIYSLWNFFHTTSVNGYYISAHFANQDAYASVTWPSVTSFNDENLVAVGDNVTIPAAPSKVGYTFIKYNDGTNDKNPGDSYEVTTSPVTIKPVFSVIEYSITYHLDGGINSGSNPTTYTIETATITLNSATKDEKVFGGWYTNPGFEGDPVTTIAKGSTGTVNLYAKWDDPVPEPVDVSASEVTILNSITPNIIVKGDLTGRHYLAGEDLNASYVGIIYTLNVNAFTTLSAAIAAASENDVIYVFAGTYSGDFTISDDNVSIIGPYYNVLGTGSRASGSEASISGKITVAANNVTLRGIKYAGGTSKAITWESTISNLTIENVLIPTSATGMSTSGGRTAIIASDSAVTNLVIRGVKLVCTPSNGRNAIAIYGGVNGMTVENSYISDGNTKIVGAEVMRITAVSGIINIKNNEFYWNTSSYSVYIGSGSNGCSEINFVNNIVSGLGASYTTTTFAVNKVAANAKLNIVGNKFDKMKSGDNSFSFGSLNAQAKINVKYNYFTSDVNYKCTSTVTPTYTSNYYAGTKTTTTTEVSPVASLSALIDAYKADADYATYGSVCVYE